MKIPSQLPPRFPSRQPVSAPPSRAHSPEAANTDWRPYRPQPPEKSALQRLVQDLCLPTSDPRFLQAVSATLEPYGLAVLERLGKNGLKMELGKADYSYYDPPSRTLFLDAASLSDADSRSYNVLHEMGHALDYLWEPRQGPLSTRADLGIAARRQSMVTRYRELLAVYEGRKKSLMAQGQWSDALPTYPDSKVYHEDFVTVVEAVAGQSMHPRPARGHYQTLLPSDHPSEYFADSLYAYLHQQPVKTYRYRLGDGQMLEHRYPPDREMMEARDPEMAKFLGELFRVAPDRGRDWPLENRSVRKPATNWSKAPTPSVELLTVGRKARFTGGWTVELTGKFVIDGN